MMSAITFGLIFLMGCRDESLSPLPGWNSAVHGFAIFDGVGTPDADKKGIANYAKNFPLTNQDKASIPFKVRWVSLDNKLTVNKIEIFVDMIEYYDDPDGNPKAVSLGAAANGIDPNGKLIKTLSPAAGNREWNSFTITPQEIANAYKDATVKYNKTTAVKVFANPDNPRPVGKWFNGTEDFVMTWRLYTTDGLVFKVFNPDSICGDPTPPSQANANCQLVWDVK